MGCVFVDVDGTLIAASSERRFFAHLVSSRLVGPRQIGAWLGYMARDFPNTRRNKAYLAGLTRADIAVAAERFVACSLESKLRAPLLHRIEWHKRNGETIVLLTGTLDEIARPLARRVGADTVVATICACTDDVYQASVPLVHPFAAAKLRLAADFARTAGVELADCAAYGDSKFDIPLLQAVGRPVAVEPDATLARTAQRAGWEIIAFRRGHSSAAQSVPA
jgi:HAD superfamily hydrolase (TIGR01490 family)